MIKLNLINEMLRHAKKSADSGYYKLTQDICFIDGRWFWVSYEYRIMLSDVLSSNSMSKLLDGKCIRIHEDIKDSIHNLFFTQDTIERYQDKREGIEHDINRVKELFNEAIKSERVSKDSVFYNEDILINAGKFFSFFKMVGFYGTPIESYFLEDRVVFNCRDRYMLVAITKVYN